MRFSSSFIYTLKEDPAEAEVISHRLLLRGCYIRKLASGIYNILPLGTRVMKKIENIIREEMNRAGALEIMMPCILPAELWKETGRWDVYGPDMLRIKDRNGREFCFGPTHEEVVTDIVRKEIRSYKQLPFTLYQIQTKFRDEVRPRFGLMRGREFIMKDAYSFGATEEQLDIDYRKMYEAYTRIFRRCGLSFVVVDADSGAIGGSSSSEFMVTADSGEDSILLCPLCNYGANVEKCEFRDLSIPPEETPFIFKGTDGIERKGAKERVSTPNIRTIQELSAFLGIEPNRIVKTLFYLADEKPVAVLIRGDRELNEVKLKNFLGAVHISMMPVETIEKLTGAGYGFSGPVGLSGVRLLADRSVEKMKNFVTGANSDDEHLINVNLTDFTVESFADFGNAQEGDGCPRCEGRLTVKRGIEVGHIFKLGTKYSCALGARFLDEKGEEKPVIMGCYGIGVGRTMAAAIEQHHDEDGIIWPMPIAPFSTILVPINMSDQAQIDVAEKLYSALLEAGVEVLYDDRDVRAGIKFKDADLLGIPIRITIGKAAGEGKVEWKRRHEKERVLIPVEEAVELIKETVARETRIE